MQLTTNQQRVLTTLQEAGRPLSAYAVLDRLRVVGFTAPTQVYRALERLTEHGLVHRLASLNAYVSCAHNSRCMHGFTAFAICDNCGHIDEFVDSDLSGSLGRWAKKNGFSPSTSAIEIRGKCGVCTGLAKASQNLS